jgi:hypothetical protein
MSHPQTRLHRKTQGINPVKITNQALVAATAA